MVQIILTGQVKDSAQWEEGFKTHTVLFKKQTIVSPVRYTVNEKNEAAITCKVSDLDTFLRVLDSQETADAMDFDGVDKETVKLYVLDKELSF